MDVNVGTNATANSNLERGSKDSVIETHGMSIQIQNVANRATRSILVCIFLSIPTHSSIVSCGPHSPSSVPKVFEAGVKWPEQYMGYSPTATGKG